MQGNTFGSKTSSTTGISMHQDTASDGDDDLLDDVLGNPFVESALTAANQLQSKAAAMDFGDGDLDISDSD